MKSVFLFLAVLGLFAVRVAADDMAAAQARIQGRQAEVAALKEKGALGENNRGFLELRDAAAGAGQVVQQENRDREILYGVVAKRTNTSVEDVGRQRAKSIAAASKPGVWLQRESGEWYQK